MDKIKEMLRGYQWNNPNLKKRYQLCDYTAMGLCVLILVILKTNPQPLYIWGTLAIIIALEYFCYKMKKEDKLTKSGGKQ